MVVNQEKCGQNLASFFLLKKHQNIFGEMFVSEEMTEKWYLAKYGFSFPLCPKVSK